MPMRVIRNIILWDTDTSSGSKNTSNIIYKIWNILALSSLESSLPNVRLWWGVFRALRAPLKKRRVKRVRVARDNSPTVDERWGVLESYNRLAIHVMRARGVMVFHSIASSGSPFHHHISISRNIAVPAECAMLSPFSP